LKVVWLQDADIFSHPGGAEQSDKAAFMEGVKRGHDMRLHRPGMGLGEADLWVVSNRTMWETDRWLDELATKPYVAYLHDYYPLCLYRLYYPGTPCSKHPYLEQGKKFVTSSLFNIFLSPLHRDAWARVIPEVLDHPYYLHPSPVPTDVFTPPENDGARSPFTLGVSCLLPFKGRDSIIAYVDSHPDDQFVFAGGADLSRGDGTAWELPPNARYIGPCPTERLADMYRQASAFIHLPDAPQPFERIAAEAKLSGIRKFIINDLVGARSYPSWKMPIGEYRLWIGEACERLWRFVEKNASP
jgi:hypothetical protein